MNLENDWLSYKTSKNDVNIKLRNAKRKYYSTKIAGQKFDPKKAWININSILGRQKKPTVRNELNPNKNSYQRYWRRIQLLFFVHWPRG